MMRTIRVRGSARAVAKLLRWGAFIFSLLPAPVALAEPTKEGRKLADTLFEQGKSALKRGDWHEACERFRRSLELDPSPSTLVKLARCHEHDGQFKAASEAYAEALTLLKDRPEHDEHTKAMLSLVRASKESVDARLGRLHIVLSPKPEGYRLTVDGQRCPLEACSLVVALDPGIHSVAVEAPGFGPETATVTLSAGAVHEVAIQMKPIAPTTRPNATPSKVGPTAVPAKQSEPFGGRKAQPNPPTSVVKKASVSVSPAPGASALRRVEPPRNTPKARTPSDGRTQRIVAVLAGGAGLVTYGIAGALGWKSKSLVNEARDRDLCDVNYSCDKEGKSLMDRAERAQTYALIAAAGGTVLVGTGLALWWTAPGATQASRNRVRLTLSLSAMSAHLGGQW